MSGNILQQIDAASEDFRLAWKSGSPPRLEDFLERVADEGRENLFKNLLLLDLRYRSRSHEKPTSSDYLFEPGRESLARGLDASLDSTGDYPPA